jgi:truncated hemoglobin YjbI
LQAGRFVLMAGMLVLRHLGSHAACWADLRRCRGAVDWALHLPRMCDFWDSVLFATATFKGAPLDVHGALARRTPLTTREFDRWVSLFHATVDDLFTGSIADQAKESAARIAVILQRHVATDGAQN